MKRSAPGRLGAGMLSPSGGVALSLLLLGSAVAGVPKPADTPVTAAQAQPRILGKKAVMHVYSYAPQTLEITSVTSRFFKDVDACESAVGGALRTATSHARAGDLVDAQCVAIDPPASLAAPEESPRATQLTEL